jgi:SPP1 gp7 family putative phage head morphogenesis protein
LYFFSAAKTYQQLETMNSFLVDDDGKIRTYSEFKRKVDVVHKNYNKNHLQAEYQTSKRSAQAVRQWGDIEENADLFPNLKYMTVADDKVREDHNKLHAIIKPINDPFWDTHYPPNGFRCRCYAKPTTDVADKRITKVKPDKGFSNNVGKTKEIYNSKHPYFTMPKTAKKNVEKSLKDFKKAQTKKKDE